MMFKNVLILLFLLSNYSCGAQSEIQFSFPFDKADIKFHQENMIRGASYLLWVPQKIGVYDKGRIINIAWYESQAVEKGMGFVDSLLNVGIVEEDYWNTKFKVPILKSELAHYKKFSTCDIINLLFTKEGYFRGWNYYTDIRTLIAVLLVRDVKIFEVDYNGELVIVPKMYNCYK